MDSDFDEEYPAERNDQVKNRRDRIDKVELEDALYSPVLETIQASVGSMEFDPLKELLVLTVEPDLRMPGYVTVHARTRPHHKEI